jgi:hypothetical protein
MMRLTTFCVAPQVKTASDGHPELCAAPVSCLLDSLPLQPSITGHLVPQSINMWMGAAQEGAQRWARLTIQLQLQLQCHSRSRLTSPWGSHSMPLMLPLCGCQARSCDHDCPTAAPCPPQHFHCPPPPAS